MSAEAVAKRPVGLVLRSNRFRLEREADWRRLDALLRRVEGRGAGGLSDDELLAIPRLYRSALSSLSVARAISLDQGVIAYLESLCARAYYFVYGARTRFSQRVVQFFRRDWPQAAQALWGETVIMVAVTIVSIIAAWLLVAGDPDWFFSFVPEGLAGGRSPDASVEDLRATLFGGSSGDNLSIFATFLFTHNAGIAILAFAIGFAFGAPSILLIAYNGCTMGAFLALFFGKGLGVDFCGWLLIHGVTELLAVTLAGAAGLHIGRKLAFPGQMTRMEAAADAGRRGAVL
ncbi:MAG: stage II sporulation protein M, partial [Alphaproteobacteria bacterium]